MYIDRVPNRNSPPAVLLRESYREDGKVRKRTVANLSGLPDHIVDCLKAALKGGVMPASEGIFNPIKDIAVTDSRLHGHVAAILGVMKNSGLINTIDRDSSRKRDIVTAMIADRLLGGDSKLSTVRHCCKETASTTLGSMLDLDKLEDRECYDAMDWLLERQEGIQKKLARKHFHPGSPVLFDLSSSYFEGSTCPLAMFGYSRDKRRDLPQVNYGIYCNTDGTPVGVDVFAGNENDHFAFPKAVERVRKDFKQDRVIFIGDRGMISGKAIDKHLRNLEGADWITALTNGSIAKLERDKCIQTSLFDERDLVSIVHPDYPDERLVICRNPTLADRRAIKREELLQATEKLLIKVQKKLIRKNKPLRGKDKIGIEVGKVINKKNVAKHFDITIEDDSFEYSRNEEKILREASLDGLYVIRSSVDKDRMTDEELVANYKNLEMVERAFRSLKSTDINVRPIHHRLENRVRAHIFICMLAYYVEHSMRKMLAPIMFADEEKEKFSERESVVMPVRRSNSAKQKDLVKKSSDGEFSISSFRDIVKSLSAITSSKICVKGHAKGRFTTTSRPSPYQRKILELLKVKRQVYPVTNN